MGDERAARGVDERSKWIEEDETAHELADALREGVPAMRQAAHEGRFMRPNPGEMEMVEVGGDKRSYTLYDLRVGRSDLPNVWADTIRSTARLPFRSSIVLDGWDDELAGKTTTDEAGRVVHREPGWVDSLTAEGLSLGQYAAETLEDALFEGIVYSFVDNDPRVFPDPASRKKAGAKPQVTKFRRRHVRRVTIEFRHGSPRLKQIVLVQPLPVINVADPNAWVDFARDARKVVTAGDPDAEVGSEERKVRTQVYVLDEENGAWVEDVEKRGRIVPDNPRDELLDIPFVPHYTRRTGPWRGVSPYLNSAWTQATIWNHNSEIGNLAREASLTHIHESGIMVDKDKKPVLPDTRNMRYHWSTDPNARLDVKEMQGTSLKAIRELIEWKFRLIEKAHHQIQSEKPTGPVTAREITLEGVHASSALEMWTIFQELAWKRILDLVALLGGLPRRGVVSIPHDFGLPNTGMERNVQLFLGDKMSAVNYWNEAKRAGDVDERTFDLRAELKWGEEQREASSALALPFRRAAREASPEEPADEGEPEEELPADDEG